MAGMADLLKSILTCNVCEETFTEPVSLSCNHSFCSDCLGTIWAQTQKKDCPLCKRKSSKDPIVNFTLKSITELFALRQKAEGEKGEKLAEAACGKHQNEPVMFCKDEERAVCSVCDFPHHVEHKVLPVDQTVIDLKEQLKSDMKSLQDKRDKCEQVQKKYIDVIQHSKSQLSSTERQIRAEFNKLHQFLKEEEESRLAAVREEEELKGKIISREMKTIQKQISSLSDTISAIKEDLQKQSMPFLSSYKDTQMIAGVQRSMSVPELISGLLIDVAKHLGNLPFRVWEKMKNMVHFSPVILDPNTASPWLRLSDDLTSMTHGSTYQQLPDNPERHTQYSNVLGSEGFSSGKHSWEVEVGDHQSWTLGLAKESVDRKMATPASPQYGIWCLWHGNGNYTNVLGEIVTVEKSLERIRVQLDYDRGEVSFYNSEDMAHIYTHKDDFTEKIFPYFSVGGAGDAKTVDIKIHQCKTLLSYS